MSSSFFMFYILIALGVGIWGRNYRFGFWGYFFATLLLSPIVGTFLVIASMPYSNGRNE